MSKDLISNGEHKALAKRNISLESCEKWHYQVGKMGDSIVQIANYYDPDGKQLVAQKVRFPNKDFKFIGEPKEAGLYGQWLWRDGGKMIVITEGELDAISVSQVQGHKWPVVSVQNGAQGAKKSLQKQIEWLEKFEKIVLMFDEDEPGKKAAEECAALFTPGKAAIAKLPAKDANEMLQQGQVKEIIDAIWAAKPYRPDGLVDIDELVEEVCKPVEIGLPWFLPSLTKITYGRRLGEIYGFGAGTGCGKTDLFTQQVAFDVTELGEHVGVIFLEQKPVETAKRVAGKFAGKRFHIPDDGWTIDELKGTMASLKGKVTFYDSWGETDWEVVKAKIRYMAVSQGIRLVYLDHLTAMADTANEKESIEQMMKEMASLANALNIIIHFVSHLSTPDGTPHEEGGRVMVKHFKGSRSIGFWSYYMFGLERDTQAEDHVKRQTTTFRVLKDRYTGQATGEVIFLSYDKDTGQLSEAPRPEKAPVFKDETSDEDQF